MAPRLCSFSLLVVSLLVLLASTENKNSNIGTVLLYNLRKTYVHIQACMHNILTPLLNTSKLI